ncbi:MAG: hypothetical protein QOJ12_566 [Thermoleophilales bacterium]|nr:hypothetical protein [Thermoleophilales bacterium]
MRGAGISEDEIRHRARIGALIRQYRGVYRVGHCAPSVLARYMAAVKACGPGALLCGLAAAYLHGLIKGPPPPPEVMTTTERRVEGLKTHRTRQMGDATRARGIPVTTVPRTLVDIAAGLDDEDLARACHEAGVKHRTTPAHIAAVLQRRPSAPGAATLRAVMTGETKVTLSKLERGFLKRLAADGLPLPETNRVASGRRVDCRWPDHKLTVELDGFRFHNSRFAWEQDYRRQREARARGDEFRRYTYSDVFDDPAFMLAELRELLA